MKGIMAGYEFDRRPKPVPPIETAHRRIATAIPAPGTEDVLARLLVDHVRAIDAVLRLEGVVLPVDDGKRVALLVDHRREGGG